MFDERYTLVEVVRAIEELRERQGTTNKQICDFVRRRAKNPNDPMKVIKTVRTLNKLVDDGVLVKKGRRYMFANRESERESDKEKVHNKNRSRNKRKDKDQDDDDDVIDGDSDADDEWAISDDDNKKMKNAECSAKTKRKVLKRGKRGGKRMSRKQEPERSDTDFFEGARRYRSRSPRRRLYRRSDDDITGPPVDESELINRPEAEKPRSREPSLVMNNANGREAEQPEGEVEVEREVALCRYRSPIGPPPPNTPGVHINRTESCCSDLGDMEHDEEAAVSPKHDRENSRRSSRRSSSKNRERQNRRRERDEVIQKARKEKSYRSEVIEEELKEGERSQAETPKGQGAPSS